MESHPSAHLGHLIHHCPRLGAGPSHHSIHLQLGLPVRESILPDLDHEMLLAIMVLRQAG